MGIRTSPAFDAEMVGGSPDRLYQLPDSIPPMMAGVLGEGGTGVIGGLQAVAMVPNSMATRIQDGRAFVRGAFIEVFGGDEFVTHDPGDSLARVDLVVLRLNQAARTLAPHVLKGTPGSSNPPSPSATADTFDLALREVAIPANATFIGSGSMGTDRRTFLRLSTPGTPFADSHATSKAYVDNLGTTTATGNTIARRNSTGRLVAAAPSAPEELTTKGYVDNSRNFTNVQTFSSQTNVTFANSSFIISTTSTTMGTVSMPSGWSLYDLLFDGYYEVRLRGSIHWRFSVTPQIQVGGTWVNATPTSHLHSVVHFSNTSGVHVYSHVAVTGRVSGLGGDQALRWRYEHSSSDSTNLTNRLWESTRRVARVTLLRRA